MFLILFLRRSTNCPQSAASQSRFQNIGRIQGRVNTAARSHDSMQLIDEENDMTIFFNVIDDVVHPFLEVSAKASASDYIHQVQLQNPHLSKFSRNLTSRYTLSQS